MTSDQLITEQGGLQISWNSLLTACVLGKKQQQHTVAYSSVFERCKCCHEVRKQVSHSWEASQKFSNGSEVIQKMTATEAQIQMAVDYTTK